MADERERTSITIINNLSDAMSSRDKLGRSRNGANVPTHRALTYYLKISKKYFNIDKGKIESRWVKVE